MDYKIHKKLGSDLLEIRKSLAGDISKMVSSYGITSREMELLSKAIRCIDELRLLLDYRLYCEHGKNGKQITGVYFSTHFSRKSIKK